MSAADCSHYFVNGVCLDCGDIAPGYALRRDAGRDPRDTEIERLRVELAEAESEASTLREGLRLYRLLRDSRSMEDVGALSGLIEEWEKGHGGDAGRDVLMENLTRAEAERDQALSSLAESRAECISLRGERDRLEADNQSLRVGRRATWEALEEAGILRAEPSPTTTAAGVDRLAAERDEARQSASTLQVEIERLRGMLGGFMLPDEIARGLRAAPIGCALLVSEAAARMHAAGAKPFIQAARVCATCPKCGMSEEEREGIVNGLLDGRLAELQRREAEHESAHLRRVIEGAPHEQGCAWPSAVPGRHGESCTCWKARALRGSTTPNPVGSGEEGP